MIEKVYRSLSPEEQTHTVILTEKYNQAAAINFFDNQGGLPPAVSGHMTYYLWGPNAAGNEVIIAYGLPLAKLESLCGEIIEAGRTYHPLAPDDNNDLPIYVCRFPKKSLSEAWPEFKRYYHLERHVCRANCNLPRSKLGNLLYIGDPNRLESLFYRKKFI